MSFVLLAALACIDPWAHRVDVSGGVSAEVRGGRAPASANTDPELAFLAVLTPNGDFRVRARRGGQFTVSYAPRLQLRLPNQLDITRPLLLHQAQLAYDVDLSRRWSLGLTANGAVGEVGYTALPAALGPGQSELIDREVIQYGVAGGDARLTVQLAPTHRFTVNPQGQYRAPIGSSREVSDQGQSIPTFAAGNIGFVYTNLPGVRDQVDVIARPGVADYDGETTYLNIEGRVGWEHTVVPELFTRFTGGVFVANALRRVGDARQSRAFPVGNLAIFGRLRARADHYIDGFISAGAVAFFQRVRQDVAPRFGLQAVLTTYLPPRWSVGVAGGVFTPLTGSPRTDAMGNPAPDESILRIQTPIGYQINDRTRFEFGTLVSVRASHFGADPVEFSRLATWLYVAIRISGGTARGGEDVLDRSDRPITVGQDGTLIATGLR